MMVKEWKPGLADEDWKVAICERDIKLAERTLSVAEYVLGGRLEDFSGAQIKSALIKYAESCEASVKAAGFDLSFVPASKISRMRAA